MKAADEIESEENTEPETTEQNTSFELAKDDRETEDMTDSYVREC